MRTDKAVEIALAKLTGRGRTRTEAVRCALPRVAGQQPSGQPAPGQPPSGQAAPGALLTTDQDTAPKCRFIGVAD